MLLILVILYFFLSTNGFWERVALQPHGSSPNFSRAFQFFQCRRFAPALKKLKSATEIRFAAYNPLKAYTQLVLFKGAVLTKNVKKSDLKKNGG